MVRKWKDFDFLLLPEAWVQATGSEGQAKFPIAVALTRGYGLHSGVAALGRAAPVLQAGFSTPAGFLLC